MEFRFASIGCRVTQVSQRHPEDSSAYHGAEYIRTSVVVKVYFPKEVTTLLMEDPAEDSGYRSAVESHVMHHSTRMLKRVPFSFEMIHWNTLPKDPKLTRTGYAKFELVFNGSADHRFISGFKRICREAIIKCAPRD